MSTAEIIAITIAAVTTLTPIVGAILQAYTDRQKVVVDQSSTMYSRVIEDNARLREERNEYRSQRDEAERKLDEAQLAHAEERKKWDTEMGQVRILLWNCMNGRMGLSGEFPLPPPLDGTDKDKK